MRGASICHDSKCRDSKCRASICVPLYVVSLYAVPQLTSGNAKDPANMKQLCVKCTRARTESTSGLTRPAHRHSHSSSPTEPPRCRRIFAPHDLHKATAVVTLTLVALLRPADGLSTPSKGYGFSRRSCCPVTKKSSSTGLLARISSRVNPCSSCGNTSHWSVSRMK